MPRRLKILPHLSKASQDRYFRHLCWLQFGELIHAPRPVDFAVRATALMFVLLLIMPFKPMAIPTVIGSALSLTLITSGGK